MNGVGISDTIITHLCEFVCCCRDGSCKNLLVFLTPMNIDVCLCARQVT